jgi:TusE/DsrC/DsvC family sulfur relay protein
MSTIEVNGKMLDLDADGNLANTSDWNEEVALAMAKSEEIEELNDRHWVVINYMRKQYEEKGDAPSIRKLTKESGVDTKELYAIFPKGPAKKAAKISGLPKPRGCI